MEIKLNHTIVSTKNNIDSAKLVSDYKYSSAWLFLHENPGQIFIF